MASWPTSIWAPTTKVAMVTTIAAAHINDMQNEVVSLETVIGVDPLSINDTVVASASPSTVAVFLDMVANQLKRLIGSTAWTVVYPQGWIMVPDTWSYASASTFTVAGDLTAVFTTGTRLRWTQTTVKYGVVVSSSYGAPNTTVTIAVNTDHVVANAAITLPYYSYAANPQGYPDSFAYTPTGLSAAGVTLSGRFSVLGRRCTVDLLCAFTGGITFTTHPTLPITASVTYKTSSDAQAAVAGVAAYWDNGTARVAHTMYPAVKASQTTVNLYRAADAVAISATVPITWANLDELTAHFSYEI